MAGPLGFRVQVCGLERSLGLWLGYTQTSHSLNPEVTQVQTSPVLHFCTSPKPSATQLNPRSRHKV